MRFKDHVLHSPDGNSAGLGESRSNGDLIVFLNGQPFVEVYIALAKLPLAFLNIITSLTA